MAEPGEFDEDIEYFTKMEKKFIIYLKMNIFLSSIKKNIWKMFLKCQLLKFPH